MAAAGTEEMDKKRQDMIASFKDVAAAMTRCVAILEDYARIAPSTLTTTAALAAVNDGAASNDLALTPTGKKRAKKDKKPKDPNAPKRPPSAYLLFQNDIREQIRTTNPELPYKEVLSVIAARWKELDENARKVYETAYDSATIVFRAQEEAYKTTGTYPPAPATPSTATAAIAAAAAAAAANTGTVLSESEPEESSEENNTPAKLPPTLAATPLTSAKKDKKRKKDDEVVATPATEAKEKKKRTKKAKE